MKRLIFAALILFCGAASSASFSIIRKYSRPIMVIKTIDEKTEVVAGNGSGIVIKEGYMISVAHVIGKGPGHRFITSENSNVIPLTIVKVDQENDLALVASPAIKCPCATLVSEVFQDEEAWTVGFPQFSTYQTQFITTGLIQNYTNNNIVATPNAAPGSSGGGLFINRNGNFMLAGIIKAIGSAPNGPSRLNIDQEYHWITFSAPADVIKKFLKGTPAEIK
jgi:S1-C subfamily serine protease